MLVASKGILDIQGLSALIGEPIQYFRGFKKNKHQSIAGWGRKKSFFRAKSYAEQHQLDLICLEDGFIRSMGLGKDNFPPLSIVYDRTGIYFDATQSSDLEQLIQQDETEADNRRATQLIQHIIDAQISKYNLKFHPLDTQKFHDQENILLIDQTFGDQSIHYAGASEASFQQMLDVAMAAHPAAKIWLKVHPDVIAGKAKGHFNLAEIAQYSNVEVYAEQVNPIALLQQMDEVYVVSSQMGFEALLCGKKVHCFGLPWYAGWGQTQDQYVPNQIIGSRRQVERSIAHLFACAYLKYARYISPVTGQRCELEQILALLEVNVKAQHQLPEKLFAYGFSAWKKRFLPQFFQFPKVSLAFLKEFRHKDGQVTLAWGKNARALKDQGQQGILTVEDGFVRSSGLGANLIRPYSLVFDDVGIYYDATRPSRLEQVFNEIELDQHQVERGKKLIEQLNRLSISKYNIGERKKLIRPQHERVVLVTGQVEDDESIRLGSLQIKTNLALLKHVREQHPDAYIIYKPHPDVHAGLRLGKIQDADLERYADAVELDASIVECFDVIDELHTITSLSGFEALLRGKRVYCYGMPFYAGWGLTIDTKQIQRRQRRLNLFELTYGVLIEYATYNLPQTAPYKLARVNLEDVITQVAYERAQNISSPKLQSTFARIRAKLIYSKYL
jgi:capsular polysaccharide export protein